MIEYENLGKLNAPFFQEYTESFQKTLQSGWYILGDNVKAFEESFANYCDIRYCVGLASGLDALILAIKQYNYPTGSEIIVPSNTYIATILAIIHNNLKPVLVEPDINSYNIDPSLIEEKISSKTKAILVVHLYGKCCEMDKILYLTNKYNLNLIEDCAQAHGAKYKGNIAGTFGDIGAFSYYPTKNLGALGDAGSIITHNESIANNIMKLRNYGSKVKYVNEIVGFNSRLDEVQAGFLIIKLRSLDKINAKKRKLAQIYLRYLKDDFIRPHQCDEHFDVFHIFNIRHCQRDKIKEYLLKNEIKTDIHYPIPPHKQNALLGIVDGHFPISEEIHNTTLSLPISYFHTEEDITKVVEVLNKF